jgi:hypothetical protein
MWRGSFNSGRIRYRFPVCAKNYRRVRRTFSQAKWIVLYSKSRNCWELGGRPDHPVRMAAFLPRIPGTGVADLFNREPEHSPGSGIRNGRASGLSTSERKRIAQ